MLNKFSKIILFYLAYLPLFLILLLLNMDFGLNLLYFSGGAILFGIIISAPFFYAAKSIKGVPEKVEIISNNNSEIIGFILPYIIPFCVAFSSLNSIIAFGILMMMIFLIYIDTNLFLINPILKIFMRYNIYQVKINGDESFLLSKDKYFPGKMKLNVKHLDSGVLIEE